MRRERKDGRTRLWPLFSQKELTANGWITTHTHTPQWVGQWHFKRPTTLSSLLNYLLCSVHYPGDSKFPYATCHTFQLSSRQGKGSHICHCPTSRLTVCLQDTTLSSLCSPSVREENYVHRSQTPRIRWHVHWLPSDTSSCPAG